MEEEKSSKFEFLHLKINEVEDRLNEINEQTNKKFVVVKENVRIYSNIKLIKIQKQIEDDRGKSDALQESKNHFIKILENKIYERFEQESQIRKEIEKKFSSLIDDRYNSLKIEISKESRNRYECIENLKGYLEV